MGIKTTKLVQGWGINDVTYQVNKTDPDSSKRIICPYYKDWASILQRCFDNKLHKNYPTYSDCTVCEDWKYLSNFVKWVDSQPNKDWENCSLDKDFLVEGNKHYSPETVVYIPAKLNTFIIDRSNDRGNCMIGVKLCRVKNKPYEAQCWNPITGKREYLGIFTTELEAHLAWKSRKHELACELAKSQTDLRIIQVLLSKYL